jgi:hypothetical protein
MTPGYPERRRHRRFPVSMAIEYHLRSGGGGTGKALNMSSNGLCFSSDRELPPGELIQVDMVWPVSQEGQRTLNLRLQGLIVRSNREVVAMSVSKYEFLLSKE